MNGTRAYSKSAKWSCPRGREYFTAAAGIRLCTAARTIRKSYSTHLICPLQIAVYPLAAPDDRQILPIIKDGRNNYAPGVPGERGGTIIMYG